MVHRIALGGFSLHADVRIAARDPGRLEWLCGYLFRPPVSDARLDMSDVGRIEFELKTPYSDGTTHRRLDPMTFLGRLAALVPPPRAHLVVDHGGRVLANAPKRRDHVVGSRFANSAGERAGKWTLEEALVRKSRFHARRTRPARALSAEPEEVPAMPFPSQPS